VQRPRPCSRAFCPLGLLCCPYLGSSHAAGILQVTRCVATCVWTQRSVQSSTGEAQDTCYKGAVVPQSAAWEPQEGGGSCAGLVDQRLLHRSSLAAQLVLGNTLAICMSTLISNFTRHTKKRSPPRVCNRTKNDWQRQKNSTPHVQDSPHQRSFSSSAFTLLSAPTLRRRLWAGPGNATAGSRLERAQKVGYVEVRCRVHGG
jgi:hypothetical protein